MAPRARTQSSGRKTRQRKSPRGHDRPAASTNPTGRTSGKGARVENKVANRSTGFAPRPPGEQTGGRGRREVPPFLIAGVGASAGGMEALTALVENVPADSRLALILIQHLAADHTSLLKQIVAKRTK